MQDYLQELPIGFGMVLLQDREAEMYFNSLSEPERQRLINKTHGIHSKQDMQAFVKTLKTQ